MRLVTDRCNRSRLSETRGKKTAPPLENVTKYCTARAFSLSHFFPVYVTSQKAIRTDISAAGLSLITTAAALSAMPRTY